MYRQTKNIYKAIKKVSKDDFWNVFGDAHTIWAMGDFIELGFSANYIKEFMHKYKSDGTHKGNIYDNEGNVIKVLEGVLSSRVAEDIAFRFGLRQAIKESGVKNGRGSALRVLSGAIWKHVHEV